MLRRRQYGPFLALIAILGTSLYLLKSPPLRRPPIDTPPPQLAQEISPSTSSSHPIHQLITKAEEEHLAIVTKQSTTLQQAVQEYRRRYQLPPPPNFDKWYEFAKARDVILIDEYDTIYHSLLPFWGIPASVIRRRAIEALGFDNALLGVQIRGGRVVTAAGGPEWQQKATVDMMAGFIEHLPAMDLPFNVHDEPRVVVPHDDLSRLVGIAKDEVIPKISSAKGLTNAFSEPPPELGDALRPYEVETTRFNRYAHQATWTESRMSCSPASPARALDESINDDGSTFSFSQFGFIMNTTAFSDICLSPSLRESYGFFDRPNAFNIVHDLFPIFSQSKISSYQDILYPSPWYWADKVPYDESNDFPWEQKRDLFYWRGSTTGGFSRNGGWRRQHRQKFVERINGLDNTKVMVNPTASGGGTDWTIKDVPRPEYKSLMDIHFAHVGQCDPGDCDAQREFFEIVKPDKQHEAWSYKYLLDIDGNAFSGRFYAFLKSMSLVYKMAVFREWHEEWLKPWVHYVPLGLKGDEYVESVRYFHEEEDGKVQGPKMAIQGREWAGKVLRKEDLEVWLFRLLLE